MSELYSRNDICHSLLVAYAQYSQSVEIPYRVVATIDVTVTRLMAKLGEQPKGTNGKIFDSSDIESVWRDLEAIYTDEKKGNFRKLVPHSVVLAAKPIDLK